MTDKELIEMAAKAAGIKLFNSGIEHGKTAFTFWDVSGPDSYDHKIFNPLTDDDDALRLAVKLKLKIVQSETATICFYGFACYVSESIESNGICRYESTRRAIVRAAAEIGKEFK